jgi:FkbM family methyltransferase
MFNNVKRWLEGATGFELRRKKLPIHLAWIGLLELRDEIVQARGASRENPEIDFLDFCRNYLTHSRSQLFQDLFVLHHLKRMKNGFFVEFGAADGIDLSNTYLLESQYEWNGILAEPARGWHESLLRNRRCAIDTRCVADRTGMKVIFNEAKQRELSTIDKYSAGDHNAKKRTVGTRYEVSTISLNDLLEEHNAPEAIDYLSVDTEGSELSILRTFNFAKYAPRVITVEHNFVSSVRIDVNHLLSANGYHRIFDVLSEFDDWYVRAKGDA